MFVSSAVAAGSNVTRSIYYARYIDWALTTPLLLLDLILLGNLTIEHTIRLMFCDLAMILAGLFGALLSTNYKWGFYAIACVFLLFIFWDLLISNRNHVYQRDARLGECADGQRNGDTCNDTCGEDVSH